MAAALRRVAVVLVIGALVALGVRLWVVEPFAVASDSMAPTVQEGATVLVSRWPTAAADCAPGRLVVFRSPEHGLLTLKRIVAVAGQAVAIRDGVLHVDGVAVAEPYVDPRDVDATFHHLVEVPAGHVFVLGDNRSASIDSRDFGTVPVEDVVGLVLLVP